jgi:hypothetical protein
MCGAYLRAPPIHPHRIESCSTVHTTETKKGAFRNLERAAPLIDDRRDDDDEPVDADGPICSFGAWHNLVLHALSINQITLIDSLAIFLLFTKITQAARSSVLPTKPASLLPSTPPLSLPQ